MTSPAKQVFHSLDGIRGVAALIVMTRHLFAFFHTRNFLEFQEAGLAVDIFFVLSGVVISHNYGERIRSGLPVSKFIWIRVVRFYPLYLLGVVVSLLSLLMFHGEYGAGTLAWMTCAAALMVPYIGSATIAYFPLNVPAWSLFQELAVNVVYAATVGILSPRRLTAVVVVSAAGLVGCLTMIWPHTMEFGWASVRWKGFDVGLLAGGCRVAYSFFMGVLLYRIFVARGGAQTPHRHARWVPWALLAAVALILTAQPGETHHSLYDLLIVLAVFPAVVYTALHFQPCGIGARICAFFGTVSYAIYALHAPLGLLVQSALKYQAGVLVENFAPWTGLAFAILLIPLCYLLDLTYDGPVRSWLGRWSGLRWWKGLNLQAMKMARNT